MSVLIFIHAFNYFAEIPEGFLFSDVIITTPVLDSLDNILKLLCNTKTVQG